MHGRAVFKPIGVPAQHTTPGRSSHADAWKLKLDNNRFFGGTKEHDWVILRASSH